MPGISGCQFDRFTFKKPLRPSLGTPRFPGEIRVCRLVALIDVAERLELPAQIVVDLRLAHIRWRARFV